MTPQQEEMQLAFEAWAAENGLDAVRYEDKLGRGYWGQENALFAAYKAAWNRRAPAPTSEPGARDAVPEPSRASRIECALRALIDADDAQALDDDLFNAGRSALATPASSAVPAAPLAPSDAILKARAEGRAEAVQIIIDLDAEDALSELTGWSSPVGPEDEGSAYWNIAKLREKFSCDDVLLNLFDKAEIMYWEASAERDEAARAKAFAENMANSAKVRDILSKAGEFDLIGQLCRAADPAPLVAQASPDSLDADSTLFCQYCESTTGHSERLNTGDAESKDGVEDWFCCHACRDAGKPCDTFHRIPKDGAAPEASPLVEDAQRIVAGKVDSAVGMVAWAAYCPKGYQFIHEDKRVVEDYVYTRRYTGEGPFSIMHMEVTPVRATTGNATADDGKDK